MIAKTLALICFISTPMLITEVDASPAAPTVVTVISRIAPVLPPTHTVREEIRGTETTQIAFKHGDISWLPAMALEAGWPAKLHEKLGKIILRESGGCPNRKGGDKVDKNCNITGVSEWNHRSDSGLTQLNGVHWKKDHPNYQGLLCKELQICSQAPLLDPFINLVAAKLLYDVAGWAPWDPCYWGPKFAARCAASK